MSKYWQNWLLLIIVSLIWGSSFILMKGGLTALSSFQVASIRILSAGLFFLPISIFKLKNYPLKTLSLFFITGIIMNFIPAYLLCYAETKLDSSLTAIFNSFTPVATVILGLLFFKLKIKFYQLIGVIISFTGIVALLMSKDKLLLFDFIQFKYGLLVILATMCYALNIYFVTENFKGIKPLDIVSIAFLFSAIPSFIILISTGYFNTMLYSNLLPDFWISTLQSVILGVLNTSIASFLYYKLLKQSEPVFSSMVTYTIAIVAIFFGIFINEFISTKQIICLCLILGGIYLGTKNTKPKQQKLNEENKIYK